MRRFVAWSLIATLSLAACTAPGSSTPSPQPAPSADVSMPLGAVDAPNEKQRTDPLWLVTLGDAYTRGTDTAAPRRDSWPAQLAAALNGDGPRLVLRNLAEPGQTSGRLLEDQLSQVESIGPDVVTVQVGVNDIIAGEADSYRLNVTTLLDELLQLLPPERILAITTPDHTLTAWGDAYAPREAGHAAVTELNGILAELAAERGITVVDISPVNGLVAHDPELVVGDGPYPSAKQYAGWVEIIRPHVQRALAMFEP